MTDVRAAGLPAGVPAGADELTGDSAPGRPGWLPDEATLNRLAGEFFAALPGGAPGPVQPVAATSRTPGGVEHAPRVDVPARSKDIPAVPGDAGGSGATTPLPPPAAPDLPGPAVDDPAATGYAPGRAVPDVGEALTAGLGAAGLGVTVPEGPIVPGLTGLQLADPGALTPATAGLAEPRPDQGLPGLPGSDQPITGAGLPGGSPDLTSAVPVRGGVGGPVADPAGMPFEVTALQVPLPGGEQLPPLPGLAAPLPSAGVPGVPASDQSLTGFGLPGGPPDVTTAALLLTGLQLGPSPSGPATAPDQPGSAPGSAAGPGLPKVPVDAAEGVSQVPLAAPFTPATGLAVPGTPPVPSLPDASAMPALSDAAAGSPAPSGSGAGPSSAGSPSLGLPSSAPTSVGVPSSAGAVASGGLPAQPSGLDPAALAGPGLPSVPQPPVPVPDAPGPVPAPSSPFYFLAESSAYQGAPDLESLAAAALNPLAADPAQVGVPSLDHPTDLPTGLLPTAGSVPPAAGAPTYYFADRVEPSVRQSTGAAPWAAPQLGADPHPPFDVRLVRRDFPILAERVNGHQLVWFDNAATTQKPQAVLDRLAHFYRHENSNIHRAAHELAARATDAYEGARKTVARFIGAESEKNIVFVRGATEAINLVAKSWGKANIHRGDEIIVSHLEHHANIVPWQQLCAETGAKLRVIPVDDSGQLLLGEFSRLLCEKTKLVSVTQVSNALGTVTPVDAVVEMAHRAGACVLIDGAQSIPHVRVNMQTLGADFFVFSGHKIYGPTGIGVVYGRTEVLESMPPWEGGGNMIADVTFEKTVFQHPPNRFEAGTGNIADAVGLGAALDYVTRIGVETIARYEHHLLEYATPRMQAVPGLHLIGTARDKASVLSFVLDGYRTEEVGAALNQKGIAVRSGHHCAQPILRRFGLEATVRPSVAFYNTTDEIDHMVAVLHRLAADRGRR